MSGDNYIEQIAVIGDQRKFVSALIVPAYPLLEKYAGEKRHLVREPGGVGEEQGYHSFHRG